MDAYNLYIQYASDHFVGILSVDTRLYVKWLSMARHKKTS